MAYYGDYTTWADPEEPLVCNSCLKRVDKLFPCTWDPEVGLVGACCLVHEDEMAHTGCELLDLLKAHVAECAVCGSTKKNVQGDRLALGTKDSVCCGEVA